MISSLKTNQNEIDLSSFVSVQGTPNGDQKVGSQGSREAAHGQVERRRVDGPPRPIPAGDGGQSDLRQHGYLTLESLGRL